VKGQEGVAQRMFNLRKGWLSVRLHYIYPLKITPQYILSRSWGWTCVTAVVDIVLEREVAN